MPEARQSDTEVPWAAPSAAPASRNPQVAAAQAADSGRAGTASGTGAGIGAGQQPAARGFRQRPIPLRPLSVLELIDGAVGAVSSVPRFLLARAAAVIAGSAAAALALTWWLNRSISGVVRQHPSWESTDLFGYPTENYAPALGERIALTTTEILIAVVCSGFAATVLAGLFAPSVKAYVDAEPVDPEQVRAQLRGRTLRLFGLAAVTTAPRAAPVALYALLAHAAAANPAHGIAGWYVLIGMVSLPLCYWLTSLTAVAAPAAVLEGVGAAAALRRSRRLATRGLMRTGWACLLTLLIAAAATAALDLFDWQLRSDYGVGAQFAALPGSPGFSWWLVAYVAAYLLTLLASTPLRASTATLLYVDRRFRREGLDIRIGWARLANRSAASRQARQTAGG
jgi:hypothetical protein